MQAMSEPVEANKRYVPAKRKIRWILYARVSLNPFGDEVSTDEQLYEMDEWIAEQPDAEVVARFAEPHRSASRYARRVREIFADAMRMLADDEADAILFWDMDRLLRQPRELEDLIDMCDPRMGGRRTIIVQSHTSTVPFDLRSADGRNHARGIVSGNARESDKISERVKRSRRRRRREGLPTLARAFGWNGSSEINEDQARHVRQAIESFLGGENMNTIAVRLNTAGVGRSRDGLRNQRTGEIMITKGWNVQAVKSLLTTPRHYGLVWHPGEENPDEGEIKPGNFQGICPPDWYWQVIHTIDRRGGNRKGPRGPEARPRRLSLLTGLVKCAGCGNSLERHCMKTGRPTLACKKHVGTTRCGGGNIDAGTVEEAVTEAVIVWVDEMDLGAYIKPQAAVDVPAIQGRLAMLEAKLEEATGHWLLPDDDPEHWDKDRYDAVSRGVKAQREDLAAQLATVTERSMLAPYAGQPGALAAAWDGLAVECRREIIIEALNLRSISIFVDPYTGGYHNRKWDPDDAAMVSAALARLHFG
jgi:DNA invertase Pin-like site-specific DNA recombinase